MSATGLPPEWGGTNCQSNLNLKECPWTFFLFLIPALRFCPPQWTYSLRGSAMFKWLMPVILPDSSPISLNESTFWFINQFLASWLGVHHFCTAWSPLSEQIHLHFHWGQSEDRPLNWWEKFQEQPLCVFGWQQPAHAKIFQELNSVLRKTCHSA